MSLKQFPRWAVYAGIDSVHCKSEHGNNRFNDTVCIPLYRVFPENVSLSLLCKWDR